MTSIETNQFQPTQSDLELIAQFKIDSETYSRWAALRGQIFTEDPINLTNSKNFKMLAKEIALRFRFTRESKTLLFEDMLSNIGSENEENYFDCRLATFFLALFIEKQVNEHDLKILIYSSPINYMHPVLRIYDSKIVGSGEKFDLKVAGTSVNFNFEGSLDVSPAIEYRQLFAVSSNIKASIAYYDMVLKLSTRKNDDEIDEFVSAFKSRMRILRIDDFEIGRMIILAKQSLYLDTDGVGLMLSSL